MSAFYNENDPKAAAWLRELIAQGHIARGVVDERSITEIAPHELEGYEQVHLFAGIGGWSYALRLAGWPDDRPVWTGSCPCQPYSVAGKGDGAADERHLWPEMFRLVRECRPVCVFGEQVEGAVRFGWLDGVCADLEGEGYSVGSAVLGAHSAGANHRRQRLYWVADAASLGHGGGTENGPRQPAVLSGEGVEANGDMADAHGTGQRSGSGSVRDERNDPRRSGEAGGLADSEGTEQPRAESQEGRPVRHSGSGRMGDPILPRPQGRGLQPREEPRQGGSGEAGSPRVVGKPIRGRWGRRASLQRRGQERGTPVAGPSILCHWDAYSLVYCADGKARRVEPGSFPLAHGIPARVGRLRGYGNAIVPQVAALFVRAFMEDA